MEKLNLGMVQHGTLTQLKLESVLLQRIIDAQRTNKGMKYIHEKIEAHKANCFRKDDQEILWFNDRIVVPNDAEVRHKFWMKPTLVDIPFILEVLRCIKT
jgi:Zn/Cd-binding protein ZinT